jgi:hypothetical protein
MPWKNKDIHPGEKVKVFVTKMMKNINFEYAKNENYDL